MTQPDPSPSPEHLTLPETSVLPETAVLPDTTAVLLAAGEGRRLGRGPKALLPLGGEPLVAVLTRRLLEGGCRDVLVVTGAYADEVGAVAREAGARVAESPLWRTGMAVSLRVGVAAADAPHLMLALVDHVGLSPALVRRVLGAHRPGRATAASYPGPDGRLLRRHPVLLEAADARAAAAEAHGDRGARDWLHRNLERVDLVDCGALDDGGDLDTVADLSRLARR
ncbi:nucleotidyltransferase family protein [Brachybacterium atlanticum]|uniref:nucleotidyltransferase family protein n=1 Tax=Brachybacterium atlanticum TaxID=2911888 RepID=UPI0021E03135|nr:NTP transferase domain-containing protein [Brachybacterium atlanticum]